MPVVWCRGAGLGEAGSRSHPLTSSRGVFVQSGAQSELTLMCKPTMTSLRIFTLKPKDHKGQRTGVARGPVGKEVESLDVKCENLRQHLKLSPPQIRFAQSGFVGDPYLRVRLGLRVTALFAIHFDLEWAEKKKIGKRVGAITLEGAKVLAIMSRRFVVGSLTVSNSRERLK